MLLDLDEIFNYTAWRLTAFFGHQATPGDIILIQICFECSAVQVSAKPTDADIIHSLLNFIKLSEH